MNRVILCAFICLLCLASRKANTHASHGDCTGQQDSILHKFVYTDVNEPPQPEGGMAVLYGKIAKNLKIGSLNKNGPLSTHLVLAFVIEKNGKINGERIIRKIAGVSSSPSLEEQAITLIKKHRWKPGLCNGKPVPCLFFLPLNIDLTD